MMPGLAQMGEDREREEGRKKEGGKEEKKEGDR